MSVALHNHHVRSTMSDTDQNMSSLLLPAHGSFKSRSSTCLPSLDGAKRTPLWLKTSDTSADREGSLSRNTEISVADDAPADVTDTEIRPHRVSVRKGPLDRTASKRLQTREELETMNKDEQLSPFGRKVIAFVGVSLVFLCMLLVGVTLRLGPIIDEMVRKENEEMYRAMSNLPSSAPVVPEVPATTNDTGTATGHPG